MHCIIQLALIWSLEFIGVNRIAVSGDQAARPGSAFKTCQDFHLEMQSFFSRKMLTFRRENTGKGVFALNDTAFCVLLILQSAVFWMSITFLLNVNCFQYIRFQKSKNPTSLLHCNPFLLYRREYCKSCGYWLVIDAQGCAWDRGKHCWDWYYPPIIVITSTIIIK